MSDCDLVPPRQRNEIILIAWLTRQQHRRLSFAEERGIHIAAELRRIHRQYPLRCNSLRPRRPFLQLQRRGRTRNQPLSAASLRNETSLASCTISMPGLPAFRPSLAATRAEPLRSVRVQVDPAIRTLSPARWNAIGTRRSTSSISPTTPTTGVGHIASPFVSLYRLTFPLITGIPSALAASAIPRIAS